MNNTLKINRQILVSKKNYKSFLTSQLSTTASEERKKEFENCEKNNFSSQSYVRRAQASEIFRSSFKKSSNGISIPLNDLDDLIIEKNTRPSLFISPLEGLGHSLGLISKIIPKDYSSVINKAVDEATNQQFNDCIRSMQIEENSDIDIKETLKFHRDFSYYEDEKIETRNEDTNSGKSNEAGNCKKKFEFVLSNGLYHLMKFTAKL